MREICTYGSGGAEGGQLLSATWTRALNTTIQTMAMENFWQGRHFFLVVVVCALVASLRFLWPADTSFVNDEPELLSRALDANQRGEWTTYGLQGSRGTDYGPVPILFYRGVLKLTRNPVAIVVLKTALVTLLTLFSVLWLMRLLPSLPPWAAVIPFLSPYLWVYARDLWDNSLNIPLCALFFVSYLGFTASHRGSLLCLATACGVLAFQVHLMALSLLGAASIHFIVFERSWWKKHTGFCTTLVLLSLVLCAPYLRHLVSVGRPPMPLPLGSGLGHLVFGGLGARFFTAVAFEYFMGWGWFVQLPLWGLGLGALAVGVTLFAFVPSFYGMVCAGRDLLANKERTGVGFAANAVGAMALVIHVGMVCLQQLISHPHYYNAIWIVFFYFFALGLGRLLPRPVWRACAQIYGVGLVGSLVLAIGMVHFRGGNRQLHHGPTLANQMQVAGQLNCFDPAITVVREACTTFPHALDLLRRLVPCPSSLVPAGPAPRLRVRYRDGDSRAGWIELVPWVGSNG